MAGRKTLERPLESLVSRARRIARLRKIREGSVNDEDVDGPFASGKVERTDKSGKSAKLSTENPALQQKSSTSLDLPGHDANNNTNNNQNTDNESNTDPNASDSDAKSNVSSKTSLSKRSIKSTNSTTSPILTPSSSPPVKKHPESPPAPPPSPPERLSSNYVLNKMTSWIWKPRGQEEVVMGKQKLERKKWELNREEWIDHPLFAAVTAIKVTKRDLADLIYPETTRQGKEMEEMTQKRVKTKQTPGLKRFFNSEVPFIAYVRTTGLEGREDEDLLQIVRDQIRDVMRSYEQTDKRKKEAISAAEGYLPLESRLGGFLTQEDLQRQFALPSWRKRELEFLSEGLVKMRRRKEERRIQDGEIKEWVMGGKRAREEGVRTAGGKKEDGEQQEEKKKKENEPKDQVQPSQESDTSHPEPFELPPCTPTEYFSHRRHRLHNFWTQEAQPADFNYAKAIKRTTFRNWRGVKKKRRSCSKVYRSRWTTSSCWSSSSSSTEDEEENKGRKTAAEWFAGYQQRKRERMLRMGTSMDGSGRSVRTDTGESPVSGGSTRRKKNQTRQEWAEDDGNKDWEGGKGEDSDHERRILADDLELVVDASEDEDILRFLGDRCDDDDDDDDDDDVGGEGGWIGSEGVGGDEDSYPLVDHVRESMMNEY
ncbi:hypothetical protein NEUTE1DRAFT_100781 [Neurospora tetrasperma FGSC 2508]|uniref:Uncharacterized protein n=1 Tax=Neurospora tetrasperma (strain FGSC 2508 / ATCC MYA-4615 / P0657) TaxID=510951 RepID=F8MMM3_NEUT8|nr:uncharacterized protein NEUTE1DRAFT_100781 [Neurospora tetrasperma FGSC 2508]EGO57897.1 hypothetical protein NEUTE1DRAFT_100781 [Neurospora tetrasperma FGSC 2508]